MLEIWGCGLSTSAAYTQVFTVCPKGFFYCMFSKNLSAGRWKEEMGNEICYGNVDSFQWCTI